MAITLKNEHDIAQMRVACKLASEVLDYITPFVTAGVTTGELDRLCHEYMLKEQGTVPAPLNYQPPGYPPYPKATCISVNDVICHGIPGDKTLKNGDALNIDITVIKEGYFGDTSRMFIWATSAMRSRSTPRRKATAWCANIAATASARCFTKTRRFCTTAAPAPGSNCKPA
jgi:methionyl aminopeptidase